MGTTGIHIATLYTEGLCDRVEAVVFTFTQMTHKLGNTVTSNLYFLNRFLNESITFELNTVNLTAVVTPHHICRILQGAITFYFQKINER